MRDHAFYRFDEKRSIAWVLLPKAASTAIRRAIRSIPLSRDEMLEKNARHHTIGVLRHPLDRATCALYSLFMPDARPFLERFYAYRDDIHLCPISPIFDEIRVDEWLYFDTLNEQWEGVRTRHGYPELVATNVRARPGQAPVKMPHAIRPLHWKEAAIDWKSVAQPYERDWALDPSWERP